LSEELFTLTQELAPPMMKKNPEKECITQSSPGRKEAKESVKIAKDKKERKSARVNFQEDHDKYFK